MRTEKKKHNPLALVILSVGGSLAAAVPASGQVFNQTNLVSDIPGMAKLTDANLVNPWGVSRSATSPFWVSNAGTKTSTLYAVNPGTGEVSQTSLVVTVPGPPSGQVMNSSSDFVVTGGGVSQPARFLFAGLDGKIYGWNSEVPPPPTSTQAILEATGAAPAVYTGITIGTRSSGQFLYAVNSAAGRIDVFDKNLVQVSVPGTFSDPQLPAGNNIPFNIANINGSLYVTYTGPAGLINVFDTDGHFVKRFATDGTLLNPWGMAVAPPDFGPFSNALLVGNFNGGNASKGPGTIGAYNLATGEFLGLMKGPNGNPVTIDGLWELVFGNGGSAGSPNVLYFAAGIQDEKHGLFGSLSFSSVSPSACGPVISSASASPDVIWPPSDKYVPVTIKYSVADACDSAPVCSLSMASSENPGKNPSDTKVMDDHSVEVLASRDGKNKDGHVYSVQITCQDSAALSSSATVSVTVPHDKGK
jgi:uncharacterized protein (TIGR03118 family)